MRWLESLMVDARVGSDEGISARLMRRVMALASDMLEVSQDK